MAGSRAATLARLAPLATGVAALALAAGIWLGHRAETAERAELAALAARHHLPDTAPGQELAQALRRAPDTDEARLMVARRLVVRGLEPYSPTAVEATVADLATAGELSREVLARRPVSWEAATLAGAATYLSWSWQEDPRLITDYQAWEEPLLLAHRLAPGKPEPERFLAAAYLELWPYLSADKRAFAGTLVEGAFRDPRVYERLVEPWFATYDPRADGDLDRLLAPLPKRADAWVRVMDRFAATGDWPAFCQAWGGRRDALFRQLEADIEEARVRVATGRPLDARGRLYGLLSLAPLDRRFVPLVERAMAEAAPGPVTDHWADSAVTWLDWGLDLCDLAPELCPLTPATVARLAATATGAQLVGEDRARIARRARSGPSRTTLPQPAAVWPPGAWRTDPARRSSRLDLTPTEPATGLVLAVTDVPADGTAVELRLDGASLGCRPIAPSASGTGTDGRAVLPLPDLDPPGDRPLGGTSHRLEIETLGPGRVAPGEMVADEGG